MEIMPTGIEAISGTRTHTSALPDAPETPVPGPRPQSRPIDDDWAGEVEGVARP